MAVVAVTIKISTGTINNDTFCDRRFCLARCTLLAKDHTFPGIYRVASLKNQTGKLFGFPMDPPRKYIISLHERARIYK